MEILLWLVPPALVTLVAMVWVSWLGREGRGTIDRDVAVRRLGEALDRSRPRRRPAPGYAVDVAPRDRSTGVAVRATSRPPARPAVEPVERADRRAS